LFLLPLLLALIALGLVFLTPLFATTPAALSTGDVACAQQHRTYRQSQS
jgi:hypothetical protein